LLAVQRGGVGNPVALESLGFIAGEAAVHIDVEAQFDRFAVRTAGHPDLAAPCGGCVNACLHCLFGQGPGRAVVGIVPVRRDPHDDVGPGCPHGAVRLIGPDVHRAAAGLNPRLAVDVQIAHGVGVVARIHAGRVRLNVHVAVGRVGQQGIDRDIAICPRRIIDARVVVCFVPVNAVEPQRRR
jgi:hypothetical protein